MRYPVNNWDKWYIAQGFGAKTDYGYHEGEDINILTGGDSDLGQPLYAVGNGKIVYYHAASHATSGFGKHMVLECDTPKGKRWFHYAHCLELTAQVKEVKEGDQIGKLGKSGTTLAHLHFTCFKVDPSTLLKGIDSIAKTLTDLKNWESPIAFIESVKGAQPAVDELASCVLEREKATKDRDENWNLYQAEKTKTGEVRKELDTFVETLASKLNTIADKAEIVGSVERLVSQESEMAKKLLQADKAYALLESEKKAEIEALSSRVNSLETELNQQLTQIVRFKEEIETLKNGGSQTNRSFLDIIKDLFESWRNRK